MKTIKEKLDKETKGLKLNEKFKNIQLIFTYYDVYDLLKDYKKDVWKLIDEMDWYGAERFKEELKSKINGK